MNARLSLVLVPLALAVVLAAAPADARPHRARRAPREFAPAPPTDRDRGQLERTRELLDRGRERLQQCGDGSANDLLASAADMQGRAEQAAGAGQHLAALQLTMGARVRIQRALQLCNVSEDDRESARRTLLRTDAVLERMRGAGGGPPPGRSVDVLGHATDAQERARRAYADGRLEESVQLSLTARAWAMRAARLERRGR